MSRNKRKRERTTVEPVVAQPELVKEPETPKKPEGVVCPKCFGRILTVYRVRRVGQKTIRTRRCAKCMHKIVTSEIMTVAVAGRNASS